MKAVLSIGTNMGDRKRNITDAFSALNLLPGTQVIQKSYIYETEPWGFTDQAKFLNCAVVVETSLSPNALLGACLGIEAGFGRVRQFKNGPRILDVDILYYEDETIDSQELTIPHKFINERDFVLVPLKDLFPDCKAFSFDFSESYNKIDKTTLKRV